MTKEDNLPVPIYWQGALVGHIANLKVDMFHQYGEWFPESTEVCERLMKTLESDSDNTVRVGLIENKPSHYISIDSFSTLNGKISIDLIQILNPPRDW